jgi:hypothetical protein
MGCRPLGMKGMRVLTPFEPLIHPVGIPTTPDIGPKGGNMGSKSQPGIIDDQDVIWRCFRKEVNTAYYLLCDVTNSYT